MAVRIPIVQVAGELQQLQAGDTISVGGGVTSQVPTLFTTTSTSLVDVTGLTFAALANSFYEVDVFLVAFNSATNSEQFTIGFSAAGAVGNLFIHAPSSAITVIAQESLALGNVGSGYIQFSNVNSIVWIKAFVITGANAGNITVKARINTSGTLSIQAGSRMTVNKLA